MGKRRQTLKRRANGDMKKNNHEGERPSQIQDKEGSRGGGKKKTSCLEKIHGLMAPFTT